MSEVTQAAPAAAPSTSAAMSTTAAPSQSVATSTAPVTTETINPGAWTAGFNDDMKGYVTSKGIKDPATLLESYRNIEKLMGAPKERLLKLPEKFVDETGAMTAEGREIAERLGAPKDAKSYEIEKFLKDKPEAAAEIAKTFHELGISKTQADKLMAWEIATQEKQAIAAKEAAVVAYKSDEASLKKTWGAAYDQNVNAAKQGAARLGHDAKTIDALSRVMGHEGAMKLYHQLGTAVGESAFIQGKPTGQQIMDPAGARAQIATLKSDKGFQEKFLKGDSEAIANWTRLHQMASPGDINFR